MMLIAKQIFGVVLFFSLALSNNGFAATESSEDVSTLSQDSPNSSLLIAAKKKKSTKGKKKKKSKKTTTEATETTEEGASTESSSTTSPQIKPMGIKGVAGITTGSSLITGFMMGGDFVYLIFNPITIEGGATFNLMSKEIEGEKCTNSYTLQTFDGGGVYHMFMGSAISIDAGARVGLGMYSNSRACDPPYTDEEPEQGKFSGNSPLLGIQAGASYHMSLSGMALSLGPEIRKPIFFSSDFKDFSVMYMLFALKLGF